MKRKKQEITDILKIKEIISKATICRLALSLKDKPYIIPLCFGFENDTLYFHTGTKGTKIEILKENSNVCFEIEIDTKIVKGDTPCKWTMHYKSIIGNGKAFFIKDKAEKVKALDTIMRQYGSTENNFPDSVLKITEVIKVKIDEMAAKQSGFPELSK